MKRFVSRPLTVPCLLSFALTCGSLSAQTSAGALVGLETLAAAAFTAVLAVRSGSAELGVGAMLGEAGFFLLVAVALGAVAAGLWTGRRWARTPAIVTQLLLLPVVYSLIGPSQQLVLGLVAGVVVAAAFMLLISEQSRAWSMGDER